MEFKLTSDDDIYSTASVGKETDVHETSESEFESFLSFPSSKRNEALVAYTRQRILNNNIALNKNLLNFEMTSSSEDDDTDLSQEFEDLTTQPMKLHEALTPHLQTLELNKPEVEVNDTTKQVSNLKMQQKKCEDNAANAVCEDIPDLDICTSKNLTLRESKNAANTDIESTGSDDDNDDELTSHTVEAETCVRAFQEIEKKAVDTTEEIDKKLREKLFNFKMNLLQHRQQNTDTNYYQEEEEVSEEEEYSNSGSDKQEIESSSTEEDYIADYYASAEAEYGKQVEYTSYTDDAIYSESFTDSEIERSTDSDSRETSSIYQELDTDSISYSGLETRQKWKYQGDTRFGVYTDKPMKCAETRQMYATARIQPPNRPRNNINMPAKSLLQPRKNRSFTNMQLREIQRNNKILVHKILSQKSTFTTKPQLRNTTPKIVSAASINRKKQQRQIDLENNILKNKIQAIAMRRSVF